jgi:hypothetical protein
MDLAPAGGEGLNSNTAATVLTPAWLGGFAARGDCRAAEPERARAPRPASYLARWHVLYRDDRGQVHCEIQVQCVDADLGIIDAWCEARSGMDRFALSGFARVVDDKSGQKIDLAEWLGRRHHDRSRAGELRRVPAPPVRGGRPAPAGEPLVAALSVRDCEAALA